MRRLRYRVQPPVVISLVMAVDGFVNLATGLMGTLGLAPRGGLLPSYLGVSTTLGTTSSAFVRYAREADVQVQKFVNRTDLACGSTIGPITAARLGIPTLDVGNPMLSMHSVREMCGSADALAMIKVLERHFA